MEYCMAMKLQKPLLISSKHIDIELELILMDTECEVASFIIKTHAKTSFSPSVPQDMDIVNEQTFMKVQAGITIVLEYLDIHPTDILHTLKMASYQVKS